VSEASQDFQIEWHGNTIVVIPSGDIESMQWELSEQAATMILEPLEKSEVPLIVFDLSQVNYFGSLFLSLLLRCHKRIRPRGGELVLCGASDTANELLQVTALNTLWAIYDTRKEALAALDD